MTNQEIERMYGSMLEAGHTVALRAVYMAGYANGAGKTIDGNLDDVTKTATVPTVAQVQQLKTTSSKGHKS